MPARSDGLHFMIDVDGQPIPAAPGQTVAAALLAAGIATLRHTASARPRGIFCGMGVCFDCLVTINDIPDQRACMALAAPGMRVRTGKNVPLPLESSHERV